MSRILVTGGTGFAGSHLLELLQTQNHTDIHATSYSSVPDSAETGITFHQVDLTNADATFELIEKIKPDLIYNLAAFAEVGSSYEKANAVFANNTFLQLNLLNAVKEHTPKARIIVIGSAQEYDVFRRPSDQPITEKNLLGPINPYGVSKVTQDLLALSYHYSYKLDVVRVRPFNHIGERQSADFAIPSFAQQIVAIERGEQTQLQVGNMESIRDFTDVKDMALAYTVLAEKGNAGEVYNIGSGVGTKMKDLLDMMINLSTSDIPVMQDPDRQRPLDVPVLIADTNKIQSLGWQPTITLEETLTRIIKYWRQQ